MKTSVLERGGKKMKGNAIISHTILGFEDHGILTSYLYLKQESSGQGFGGFGLGAVSDKASEDITAQATLWIKRILQTVGVEKWEDLPGKYIRVDGEEFGDITGIGHIIDNKWFYPKEEFKKYFGEKINGKQI